MFYDPQLRLCDACQAGEIMHKILVGPRNCLSIAQLGPTGKEHSRWKASTAYDILIVLIC